MASYRILVVFFLLGYVQSQSRHAMNFPTDLASAELRPRSGSEGDFRERNCSVGQDCRLLQSCKSLFLLLEAMNTDSVRILMKAQCGFVGKHPKVCCDIGDNRDEALDPSTIFPRPSLPDGVPSSGGREDHIGGGSISGSSFPKPAPTSPSAEEFDRPSPPFPSTGGIGGAGRPAPPLPFPSQPSFSTSRPVSTTLRPASSMTTIGLSQSSCGSVPPSRVLEGDVPEFGFYTWAVTLRFTVASAGEIGRSQLQCGGTLISERHVLTAAHCLEGSTRHQHTLSEIVIGDYDLMSTPDCITLQNGQRVCSSKEIHRTAASIIIHPNYIEKTRANDIAIIKLNASVPLTIDSVPICLPPFNQDITPILRKRRTQTSGWGLNADGSIPYVKRHQISLKYEDASVCSQYYNVKLSQGQLCFSSRDVDKNDLKCTKDSGGALFTHFDMTGPPFTQVGIVSIARRGARCSSRSDNGPTIVTDVQYYLPWINQHIV